MAGSAVDDQTGPFTGLGIEVLNDRDGIVAGYHEIAAATLDAA